MHNQYPHVYPLAVHLENEQPIYFEDNADITATLNAFNGSTLTEWFETNKVFADGRNLTYPDFCDKFVWNKATKKWTKRKKDTAVSRMIFVSPSEGEKYFLRMLLTQVTGATSFENVRTYKNVIYKTFKEACIARGILGDDNEWHLCMQEAAEIQTGSELRHLFALILSTCDVSNPLKLWEQNIEHLCEDLLHKKRKKTNNFKLNSYIKNQTLQQIEKIMQMNNKSLSMFSEFKFFIADTTFDYYENELNFDYKSLNKSYKERKKNLTIEQKIVFKDIIKAVYSKNTKSKVFYIDGFGGSGKTYFYNTLLPSIRKQGNIAIAMASSGISSLLLQNGRTAHFTLKIPLKCNNTSTCDIKPNTKLGKLIQNAKIFVWDEAPMLDKYCYETVDRTLRDLMKNIDPKLSDIPFGGKVMVFEGDFRQTLPVVRHGNRSSIVSSCINRSYLWKYMQIYKFTINKRIEMSLDTNKNDFSKYLLKIGEGTEPTFNSNEDDLIKLPDEICMNLSNPSELINYIYDDLSENYSDTKYIIDRAILATTNKICDNLNEEVLKLLPTEHKVYYSADSTISENEISLYPSEYLNTLTFTGLPPHKLHLKKNAVVICLRNLNSGKGLCNGTRLIVRNRM